MIIYTHRKKDGFGQVTKWERYHKFTTNRRLRHVVCVKKSWVNVNWNKILLILFTTFHKGPQTRHNYTFIYKFWFVIEYDLNLHSKTHCSTGIQEIMYRTYTTNTFQFIRKFQYLGPVPGKDWSKFPSWLH